VDPVNDEVEAHQSRQLRARAVDGWNYVGCVTDGANRALTGHFQTDSANTVEKCINTCATLGFIYAGMGCEFHASRLRT
jgi:hypothetical protein